MALAYEIRQRAPLRLAEKSRLPSRMYGGMYTRCRNARDMFPVKLSISASRAIRQRRSFRFSSLFFFISNTLEFFNRADI